jgi:hypothetical protein
MVIFLRLLCVSTTSFTLFLVINGQNVSGQNISATKRIGTKRIAPKLIGYKTYRRKKHMFRKLEQTAPTDHARGGSDAKQLIV